MTAPVVALAALLAGAPKAPSQDAPREPVQADLVVYGGTSAAVATAVQAVRMNRSVVIVCPDRHLGGLSSGGLGWTDSGDKRVVGGVSREFYRLVREHLEPGGLFVQWFQRYATSDTIAGIVVDTLRSEFPHLRLFHRWMLRWRG